MQHESFFYPLDGPLVEYIYAPEFVAQAEAALALLLPDDHQLVSWLCAYLALARQVKHALPDWTVPCEEE